MKLPKTPQGLIDKLYTIREQRLELEREAKHLHALEEDIRERLYIAMPRAKITIVQGRLAQGTLKKELKPRIEDLKKDWPKIADYILSTGAIQLVERRLRAVACREYWALGHKIPRVAKIEVPSINVKPL